MESTGFAHWLVVLVEAFAALFLLLLMLFVVVLLAIWVVDRNQTGNAVLRNFPIIGHFRYWFLHLGEFFRRADRQAGRVQGSARRRGMDRRTVR